MNEQNIWHRELLSEDIKFSLFVLLMTPIAFVALNFLSFIGPTSGIANVWYSLVSALFDPLRYLDTAIVYLILMLLKFILIYFLPTFLLVSMIHYLVKAKQFSFYIKTFAIDIVFLLIISISLALILITLFRETGGFIFT